MNEIHPHVARALLDERRTKSRSPENWHRRELTLSRRRARRRKSFED